ncbi:MAG: DUF4845 domain-containing protein [Saccharospirillum sp.]
MRTPGRERGLSLWGVLLLVFLVVFFGTLVVKLSGPYYDQFTLDAMLSRMVDDTATGQFSESEFRDRVRRNVNINNIQVDVNRALSLDRRANPPMLILDYEERIHLFANVDVILTFYEEYEF